MESRDRRQEVARTCQRNCQEITEPEEICAPANIAQKEVTNRLALNDRRRAPPMIWTSAPAIEHRGTNRRAPTATSAAAFGEQSGQRSRQQNERRKSVAQPHSQFPADADEII